MSISPGITYLFDGDNWRAKGRLSLTSRDGLVPGTYKPGPTTTGTLPGVSLTAYSGSLVTSNNGQVIENLDMDGYIVVNHANVIIRNCRVKGLTTGTVSLINATSASCINLQIIDCEIYPSYNQPSATDPNMGDNGIMGHDFTARRCNIHRCIDGIGVDPKPTTTSPSGVRIEACWIHDLAYYSPDPGHADNQSHNDLIQIHGGSGTEIVGNFLDAHTAPDRGTLNNPLPNNQALSAIIMGTNVPGTLFTVTDNWFSGGNIPVNFGGGAGGNMGTWHRNLFDRNSVSGHTITFDSAMTADAGEGTANANRWSDDFTEVYVRFNG